MLTDMDALEGLEQTGALRSLLLIDQKKRYVTELLRSSINPEGIVSQGALNKIRENLVRLGLITEEMEEGPRPRTWLVITERGMRVAQKLREIEVLLAE